MTFEEAWPHIREGKQFSWRYRGERDWNAGEWDKFKYTSLYELEAFEFSLSREPRELTLEFDKDGRVVSCTCQMIVYPKGETIKVREVIE